MWAASKRIVSKVKAYYKEINTATLSGANDIVVVEQPDGSLVSSPFSVRFGKLGVMRSNATEVYIDVNGEPCDLKMVLSSKGEAFFPSAGTDHTEFPADGGGEESDFELAAVEQADVDNADRDRLVRVYSDSELCRRERGCADGSCVTPQGGVFVMDMPDVDAEHGESKEPPLPPSSELHSGAYNISARCQHQEQQQRRLRHVTGEEAPNRGCDLYPLLSSSYGSGGDPGAVGSGSWRLSLSPPALLSASMPRNSTVEPTPPSRGQASVGAPCAPVAASAPVSLLLPPNPQLQQQRRQALVERRPKAGEQGIYLDDLDHHELTAEETALYFPERRNFATALEVKCSHTDDDEDAELEVVPSSRPPTFAFDLAMSPGSGSLPSHSCSPLSDVDSGLAEHSYPYTFFRDVSLSLCGGLKDGCSGSISMDKFHRYLVTFEDFCKDPSIVDNPNLVVRLHGRLLNWKVASVVVMAAAAYHCPPPADLVDSLIKQHMSSKAEDHRRKGIFSWLSRSTTKADTPPPKQEQAVPQPSLPHTDGPTSSSASAGSAPLPPPASTAAAITEARSEASGASGAASGRATSSPRKAAPASADAASAHPVIVGAAAAAATAAGHSGLSGSSGGGDHQGSARGDGKTTVDESAERTASGGSGTVVGQHKPLPYVRQHWKTPTSEQLVQLKLQPGRNDIEFSVTTALQGTTRCTSSIHLWKWTDQIVVSDIDGTITRSDVLGQLLPMVGKDWSQVDVAKLYTKMAENGYKFVYLSARAIGQSQMTRDFLSSVRQQQATLPPGPLFLSPTSLYTAFHKEVIERKPEEFKISCLRNLKALFPKAVLSPLYAGFGNKINDVWAYRAVDIPASRVFTINTKGELRSELSQTFQSSYSKLSDVVDHFFPPVRSSACSGGAGHLREASDYSCFEYWRAPLPTQLPLPLPPCSTAAASAEAAAASAAAAASFAIAAADGSASSRNHGLAARGQVTATSRTLESRAGA